jgi:hypothetical protein
VFDQPYNRHLPGPRAATWDEVVRLVTTEIDARQRQLPLPLTGLAPTESAPLDATTEDEGGHLATGG